MAKTATRFRMEIGTASLILRFFSLQLMLLQTHYFHQEEWLNHRWPAGMSAG